MSGEKEVPKRVFQKTGSFAGILESIKNDHLVDYQLFSLFEKYPFHEVRKSCLEKLKYQDWYESDHNCEWAEDCVVQLKTLHDDLWKEVLSWYIFKTGSQNSYRALEFAITIADADTSYCDFISKLVAGRIVDNNEGGYDISPFVKMPSLKKFLEELLRSILPWRCRHLAIPEILSSLRSDENKDKIQEYSNSDWFKAERALRILITYRTCQESWDFIKIINLLILLHDDKKIAPRPSEMFVNVTNVAELHETVRLLLAGKIQTFKERQEEELERVMAETKE